jgi:hypothetical protein
VPQLQIDPRNEAAVRRYYGAFADLFLFNDDFDAEKHFYDKSVLKDIWMMSAKSFGSAKTVIEVSTPAHWSPTASYERFAGS